MKSPKDLVGVIQKAQKITKELNKYVDKLPSENEGLFEQLEQLPSNAPEAIEIRQILIERYQKKLGDYQKELEIMKEEIEPFRSDFISLDPSLKEPMLKYLDSQIEKLDNLCKNLGNMKPEEVSSEDLRGFRGVVRNMRQEINRSFPFNQLKKSDEKFSSKRLELQGLRNVKQQANRDRLDRAIARQEGLLQQYKSIDTVKKCGKQHKR